MRDKGQADRYTQLKVQYIDHHNPDLFLFDADGEEMQRIDLTRLRTLNNIHKMMRMLGMRETCRDLDTQCGGWAKSGQCDLNPAFMLESCRKSCGQCEQGDATADGAEGPPCVNTAAEHDCEYWSTMGECTANEGFMRTQCARSCGVCKVRERAEPSDEDLDDEYSDDKDEL